MSLDYFSVNCRMPADLSSNPTKNDSISKKYTTYYFIQFPISIFFAQIQELFPIPDCHFYTQQSAAL